MSLNEQEPIDDLQVAKIFRSFELNDEWCEFKYYEKSILFNLPKIIAGFIENQFLSYYFSNPPKWRLFVRKLLRNKRIVPNYVMTSPAKSGSSDLVSHLLLHPNVMTPLAKEFWFELNEDLRLYYPTEKEKQKLEEKTDHPVRCGHLAPHLHSKIEMDKLYDSNPQSKIIITLRNPVTRAYSSWKYEILMGGQSVEQKPHFKSFSEYVQRKLDLFPDTSDREVPVLQIGIYYKAVENWINRFGRENVMVMDVAEYFSNRQPTLEKIQKFLGLPIVNLPEYGKRTNENPIKRPPADKETKAMLAEFYKPYNQKLFNLIGEDFDWQ
jgi:hypothetical protein